MSNLNVSSTDKELKYGTLLIGLLALVWALAGFLKLLDHATVRVSMFGFEATGYIVKVTGILELLLAGALLIRMLRGICLLFSISAFLLFAVSHAYEMVKSVTEPCGCFGTSISLSPAWGMIISLTLATYATAALRYLKYPIQKAAVVGLLVSAPLVLLPAIFVLAAGDNKHLHAKPIPARERDVALKMYEGDVKPSGRKPVLVMFADFTRSESQEAYRQLLPVLAHQAPPFSLYVRSSSAVDVRPGRPLGKLSEPQSSRKSGRLDVADAEQRAGIKTAPFDERLKSEFGISHVRADANDAMSLGISLRTTYFVCDANTAYRFEHQEDAITKIVEITSNFDPN